LRSPINRQSQIDNIMTPERWQRVEQVLQAALDRSPRERSAFLDEACAGDDDLRRETSSLVEAHDGATDFLAEPAIAQDAQIVLEMRATVDAGREIGPYQTIRPLGAGGMGEVYLAHDPRLNRLVALKIIRSSFVADEALLRRFQTEARVASALNHANILTVYEIGEYEEIFFIATEYIDGLTIRERIQAANLTLEDVLEIARQMLSGLETAHAAGIIHRDIKPENVIQRPDGVVKILDFGIAKLLEVSATETATTTAPIVRTETGVGVMLGTIGYMSPEQVRGLVVDQRTDVWSCGVMLYEMLAQQRPFEGKTNADTLVAMLQRDAPPLFGTNVPKQPVLRRIAEVVEKALHKEPADRYQTATEMRADLERIKRTLESDKSSAVNLQTDVGELGKLAVRPSALQVRREIAMMIAAGLLVVMFAVAFFYQRHKREVASAPVGTAPKSYLQMTEREELIFVETQEQRISAMMGDRPVKLNDEAVRAIKAHVDRYARHDSLIKPGEETLRDMYARAPEYIPVIAHAFVERKIPVVVGIYLPMIESAYRPCFENEIGAKGLFQFLPATAAHYGVSRAEMCDVSKNAPAAAHYIADRMAELGDDAQSMTLVLVSYNRGDEAVRDALRRLRETDANYERNFWTLFANRDKLDEGFRRESAGYVPEFFAAAIVGENPNVFDLQMPQLSSFAKAGTGK
jgi:serine/threonine protein kinase